MKHGISLFIVAVFVFTSTGCAVMESGKNSMRQMTQMFRPNPYDEPLRPASEEDEWGFVGNEGRADQDRERDPDRWWQNLVMSPEARNIERNLGID
ncbi:MAG: hypothetical protein RIK87_20130 [Fuerstiella sp.]